MNMEVEVIKNLSAVRIIDLIKMSTNPNTAEVGTLRNWINDKREQDFPAFEDVKLLMIEPACQVGLGL